MKGLLPICYLLTVSFVTQSNGAHREHKVHNIVLYPDKHSWCQTQQIKQVISYPGCKSEEIDNNVCVGACFSYSIPHTEPSDPGEVIVPYCDSCQPSDTTWHHITLQCEKNSDKTPPQLVKRVQIINNCSCSSCESDHNRYKTSFDESEDTEDFLMMQQNDVPDLLRFLNSRNESNTPPSSNVHTENVKSLMNHKIVTLLKDIQEKNSRYDKDQLTELLRTIHGPEHHKINDEKIADFVEGLNSENVELDLVRLREVLSKFEHSKYFEKHRKYLLANHVGEGTNDLEDQTRHHHHRHQNYHPPQLESLHSTENEDENIPSEADAIDSKNVESKDHLHNHETEADAKNEQLILGNEEDINPPAKRHQTEDVVIDSIINHHKNAAPIPSGHAPHHQSPHHHHHLHPHHHVGEEIIGHGHLIQGPNGALVIEPDRIHEKLDVNPHELKPNHAGTFLSYSGQPIIEKPKTKVTSESDDD